jgi:hypothetical protein
MGMHPPIVKDEKQFLRQRATMLNARNEGFSAMIRVIGSRLEPAVLDPAE